MLKGLFVRLYIFILGCFLLSNYLSKELLDAPYEESTRRNSINYAETITESIFREYKISNTDINQLIDWWKHRSLQEIQEIKNIEIIKKNDPRIAHLPPIIKTQLINISITEMVDNSEVVVPLKGIIQKLGIDSQIVDDDDLILYHFYAAYNTDYKNLYYIGYILIFVLTASLVYVIAYYLYLYLQNLSKAVKSIADGHYTTPAPTTSIDAFKALSNDINTMSSKLKDDEIKQQIFNGAISHELRSPITRLQLALDILNKSDNQETIKEMGLEMDDALNDLNHLTDNVLQLSKAYLQHDLGPLNNIPINQTIKNLVDGYKDSRIHCQFGNDHYIQSNKSLINTALSNLIGNACKYADQKIQISSYQSQNNICIKIEDDGPGIPENERENIFQPFYRIDSSRSRQTGGSGLGLAIVHEIIRKTQGTINISSSTLGGTCFEVSWPSKNQ